MNKIIDALIKVIDSLKYYEKDYVSVKRNPVDYQERSTNMSHYIECRVNFEFFKIEELRELEELTDGHLFIVSSILGEGEKSYDEVTICINDDLDVNIESIVNYLGGRSMRFSSDKENLNLVILD